MTFVSARLSSFSSCRGRRGGTWRLSGLHISQVQLDSSVQRVWTCFSHWGLLHFMSAWLWEHRWHLLLWVDGGGVYSPVMGPCLLMTVCAMSSRSSGVVLPDMVSRVVSIEDVVCLMPMSKGWRWNGVALDQVQVIWCRESANSSV
jgi:hypothetical protein